MSINLPDKSKTLIPTNEAFGLEGVRKFLNVLRAIRHPVDGCPWDLAQSHETLMKYFFEELNEFAEALRDFGPTDPRTIEELSDCLLQVGLHALMIEEKGTESFDSIAKIQADKLISRHPHVFDPQFPRFKSAEEVNLNWEKIKAWAKAKKQSQSGEENLPSQSFEVPSGLSSLLKAMRLGEKAANHGFDWKNSLAILDKISEELLELKNELIASVEVESKAKEEFGDLLFACAQLARKRNWDPEQVLNDANQKFQRRFQKMIELIEADGKNALDLANEIQEEYWEKVKKLGL